MFAVGLDLVANAGGVFQPGHLQLFDDMDAFDIKIPLRDGIFEIESPEILIAARKE